MPLLPVQQISSPNGVATFTGKARPSVPPAIQRVMDAKAGKAGGQGPYKGMTWGPPIKYVEIPKGEAGTRATLKIMKQLVLSPWGHRNPEVVWLARQIVSDISPGPQKDYRAMAQALLEFMKTNVAYRLDPSGLEYVPTPWYTLLVSGHEDCDGHATATAALAMALGMRAGFRTVRGDRSRPDQWSHVYAVIGVPAKGGKTTWLTADSTQEESYLGWDPPEGKTLGMKTWVIDPSMERTSWHS
jgi:transglutaminase-like putative cysteine protease